MCYTLATCAIPRPVSVSDIPAVIWVTPLSVVTG
jgi:hypothetical protein